LTLALLPALPLLTVFGALAVLPAPAELVGVLAPAVLELEALLVFAVLPSPYLLSSSVTNGFVVLEEEFNP
jgi:hypothetical protein